MIGKSEPGFPKEHAQARCLGGTAIDRIPVRATCKSRHDPANERAAEASARASDSMDAEKSSPRAVLGE
jgi:hypothetical protein